jgi:sarcosine oxidase, subunit beta
MQTADIVIIGGGIIGASLAYQLALRAGDSSIVLLERDTIASGSSGRATGGIRQQFADEIDIRFSIEGVRFYEQFTHEQPFENARPTFYQHGYLFLTTTPPSWQAMQRYAVLQQALGVPTQLLSASEVQQRVPQLVVADILGATFCASDGYSDPAAMTRALLVAARERGVSIREHTPVTAIRVEHGRVQGVQTPQEYFSTPLVINAAGVYAALVARLAGIPDLPVYPLRRQVYLSEPFADLPYDLPMVVDLSTGFHFRRRGDCVLLTIPLAIDDEEIRRNQRLESAAFDLPIEERQWQDVTEQIARRCPTLSNAIIARCWSGHYEMTPDEHALLGPTEVDGFLCACGFSGHGFMHAPMATKLLVELILDGHATALPIEQFSVGRFRSGQLLPMTRLL